MVNSRDVAEAFGKEHKNVIRYINGLEIDSDLSRSWFRPCPSLDAYGREQPSFDMTRQGFTLLVMGWTGERAMQFKVRYTQAFDEMEGRLKDTSPATHCDLILAIRQIVAPLGVRLSYQDGAIAEVKARVDSMAEDVAYLKQTAANRRRLRAETKKEHVSALADLGGRCPCCGLASVVTDDGTMYGAH